MTFIDRVNSVFHAYDVRAIYPDELNEELAGNIARATAVFLKAKKLVIGRDGRNSSPAIHEAVLAALVKEGVEILDIGLCTSPWFYFSIAHSHADGGLMISASHNPPEYNGLKIQREKAIPINSETGLKDIEEMALKGEFTDTKGGKVVPLDILQEYIAHVKRFAHGLKKLKIVLDTSNGPSTLTAPQILHDLGMEVVHVNKEISGDFPGHGPNPMKKGVVEKLGKEVVAHNADLGVVYDADADRAFFVDEKGNALTGEEVTIIMAQDFLEKHPGAVIVSDLRMGWGIKDAVEELGGHDVKVRVGRSFIYHKMKDHDAILAGEMSGHFYFKDNFFCDSAIIPTIIVLNKISSSGKLSELVVQKYAISGEINFKIEDKDSALKTIEEKYNDGKMDKTDGIRVDYDDWWFMVRKSNTEPLIRLVAEAKTQQLLDKKVKEISALLESHS